MPESVKFLGGLMIIVGLALLLVVPPLGFLLLLLAAIIGVLSVVKTREKRHAEVVDAARTGVAVRTDNSAQHRLTQLEQLRRDGLVSNAEYEEKRKKIVEDL